MKKLNKVAMLFAAAAFAVPLAASAQMVQPFPAKPIAKPTAEEMKAADGSHQWKSSGSGMPVVNGTNELCWRDSNWTPATAYPGCDGAAKPPPPPRRRHRAPMAAPPAPPPPPPPAPPKPMSEKVTYAADTFFDFDKYALKPEGKAKLDDLISKMSGMNLEVIIAVGHTDSIGTEHTTWACRFVAPTR